MSIGFLIEGKVEFMTCLEMIEKNKYPYCLVNGALKRKTFAACNERLVNFLIS